MSEYIILYGALSRYWGQEILGLPDLNGGVVIVAIAVFVASTTLIYYGLIRHLGKLTLGTVEGDQHFTEKGMTDLFPLVGLAFFVVLLGLWVIPPLANLIHQSVLIVLEGS